MRSVVITGVARGLGKALAIEFSKKGYRIFGTCRKPSDAAELGAAFGAPHQFHAVDSTDGPGLAALAEVIRSEGRVDLVIANAGVINERTPTWKISRADWDLSLNVNLGGMINTIQAFLPAMISEDHGTFVGMSSGWGQSPSLGLGPYCASKYAVEGLIGCLVLDLDDHSSAVNAVALDPGGGVNTDMLADCLPDEHERYRTAKDWAPGAVRFVEIDLIGHRASGSQEVPESAHAHVEPSS